MESAPVFKPGRSKYLVLTADYFLPFLICLSVVLAGFLVRYSPIFMVKEVNCLLDYEPCKDRSLIAELDKLKDQNIFIVSEDRLSTRLTSGDFTIREVKLRKMLPDTLTVELQSVYPVVALQVATHPSWAVMDSEYKLIGTRTTDPNVPTVVVPGPLTLVMGKRPDDQMIIKGLDLALTLSEQHFTFKSLTLVDDDTVHIKIDDKLTAVFTPKKDELEQLRALQAILLDDTITKEVKTIDVRFSQPVLR
jgi:cell division septal protein FtsQ